MDWLLYDRGLRNERVKPGDSCVNHLVYITHEIYKSFDKVHQGRDIFLDILKAFDKVRHDSIIFKLTHNGISRNLLNLLRDFLSKRKQHATLNGQVSTLNKDLEMIHN